MIKETKSSSFVMNFINEEVAIINIWSWNHIIWIYFCEKRRACLVRHWSVLDTHVMSILVKLLTGVISSCYRCNQACMLALESTSALYCCTFNCYFTKPYKTKINSTNYIKKVKLFLMEGGRLQMTPLVTRHVASGAIYRT